MISNILKNNILGSVILIILIVIGGFIIVYGNAPFQHPVTTEGALYSSMRMYLGQTMRFLLSALCVTGGAFLFNFVMNRNETLTKFSFFPAFVAILISFEAFTAFEYHPAFLSNLLIILGMMRMMESYRVDDAKSMFFDGALMLSFSTLIYFPSITLFPLLFVSLIILRPFIWREWAMALIGIALPHILTIAVMYLVGSLDHYYNRGMFVGINLSSVQLDFGAQYFVLICLAFLFLLMLFNRLSGGSSRKIRQQKNINSLTFWLLFGVASVFYETPYRTSVPLLAIPPVAGLLGEWLGNFRRNTLSDFAVLLLVAAFTLSVMQIHGIL